MDQINDTLCLSVCLVYLKSNPAFFLCLNTSFVFTNHQPRQRSASYNRAFIVDSSSSGKMTSKLFIFESKPRRPAASLILISRMTSSSVIVPYRIGPSNLFRGLPVDTVTRLFRRITHRFGSFQRRIQTAR